LTSEEVGAGFFVLRNTGGEMKIIGQEGLWQKGIRLSRTQLWRLETAGKFPKRIHLSARCIGWREDQIDSYIEERSRAAVAA
jgi:prophage regulatory protein